MLPVHIGDRREEVSMDIFYEATYRVETGDVDLFGHCRPSAVLRFLQEAAIQGGSALGVSRDEVARRYHAFWMLSRIRYELKRPLLGGEMITVKTWHRGGKGAVMYREFDLKVGEESVGQALSIWVLADLDSHKLFRMAGVAELEASSGGSLCRGDALHKLRMPEGLELAEERRLHYSETDINGHINNVRYADFACDALGLEKLGQGRFVSSLHLCYLAECLPGETLELHTGIDGQNCYISGRGKEKKERFDALLTLDNLS